MTDHENPGKVINPHDKLFRDTYSDRDNARSLLTHHLPEKVLGLMDMSTLEISKDSFIGKKEWPQDAVRLSSLLSGPKDELSGYIPDFGFELFDLHRFSDDQIKGTIMNRVVLLLFKYIFTPRLQHRLPEIFSLFQSLVARETGLQYLETVIRYLASVLDEEDLSLQQIKEMAERAISKETGEYVMTLAEKLRNEGKREGKLEGRLEGKREGKREGYKEAIELGITLKFPADIHAVMAKVNKIDDLDTLKKIKEAIKTAQDISDILALVK